MKQYFGGAKVTQTAGLLACNFNQLLTGFSQSLPRKSGADWLYLANQFYHT
jgi:hypothetical protein